MNSFLTTQAGNYNISMYYREVKEIIEIKRAKLTRKRLNDTFYELPHMNYNGTWIPLFDFQLILNMKTKVLPKFAVLINDIEENVKYGICFPETIEEVKVEKKDILIFPDLLLKKQPLTFMYGIIYIEKKPALFLSFSEISYPENIADFIFQLKKGEKYGNYRRHQEPVQTGIKNAY